MPRPDVFDSLNSLAGMQGEEAQDSFERAPLPYETPGMTQGRVAQAQTQRMQYGRIKAEDLSQRGIAYETSGRGNVSEVTDSKGAPLTNADKSSKIAYDSSGKPVDYSQRDPNTGKAVVKDAYEGIQDWTEPKTGNTYKVRKDLPWLYTGTDPQVQQQLQQQQVAKVNQQTSAALAPVEAQTKAQAMEASKEVKNSGKAAKTALQAQGLSIDPTDPQAAHQQIQDTFDQEYASSRANASPWFGGGKLSPDAEAYRKDIDARKAAANAVVDQHAATVQKAQDAQGALGQIQQQRAQLQGDRLADINQKRLALGLDPVGSVAKAQQQAAVPKNLGSAEQQAPTAETHTDDQARQVVQQNLTAAAGGEKAYGYDDKSGRILFDPEKQYDGLKQAARDGVIDMQWAKDQESKFKIAQEKYVELIKTAGGLPEVKALLHGGGVGGAFLAGAIPGGKAGAKLGAAIPGLGETGIGEVAGGILGGLTTGSIAAWGAQRGLDRLSEYSDALKSLNASAELHPYYDAAGQLLAYAPSSAKAVSNLVKLGRLSGGGVEAAKAIGLRLGAGAASGLAFEVGPRVVFDAAVNSAQQALGIPAQEVQAPSVKSLVTNAALGAMLAGHDLRFRNYTVNDATSILYRDKVRQMAGVAPDAEMSVPDVVDTMKKAGIDVDSQKAEDLTRPLSAAEQHFSEATKAKLKEMQDAGVPGVKFESGEQATDSTGRPIASKVEVSPTGEATNEPTTPSEPSPAPPGLATPPAQPTGTAETPANEPAAPVAPSEPAVVNGQELAQREAELAKMAPNDPNRPLVQLQIRQLTEGQPAAPQAQPVAEQPIVEPPSEAQIQQAYPASAPSVQNTAAAPVEAATSGISPEGQPPATQGQEAQPQPALPQAENRIGEQSSPETTAESALAQEPSEPPAKPSKVLHSAKNVKVTAPKGAKFLQVVDNKGRKITEPIDNVAKGLNPFHQAGPFKSVTAGVLNSRKELVPLKGDITITDANAKPVEPVAPANEPAAPKQSPEASSVEKLAKAALTLHHPELDALGHPHEFETGATHAESGIETDVASKRIRIDPEKMAKATEKLTPSQRMEWIKRAVAHEVIHVGTLKYAEESAANHEKLMALTKDDELMKRAAEAYGPEWKDQSDFAKAAEAARMLIEGPEKLTEASYKFLKDFLEWLKSKLKNLSKDAREVIRGIEEKLGRFDKETEATKENAPPETETPGTPENLRTAIAEERAKGDPDNIVDGLERELARQDTKMQSLAAATPNDKPTPGGEAPEATPPPSGTPPDHLAAEGTRTTSELSEAQRNEKLMEEAEAAGLAPSIETIKGLIANKPETIAKLRAMIKDRTGKDALNAAKPQSERPYKNVPDALMGFGKDGPYQKGFHDTKYPHTQPVRVTWEDGTTMVDAIKGMNEKHAIERAHRNWPGAKIEPATQKEFNESETLGAASPAQSMRDTYDSLADAMTARAAKKEVAFKQDAVGNLANYYGQQAGDSIRLDLPEKADREAMPFVIEAGGDVKKLNAMDQKIVASTDPNLSKKYGPIIDHAINNFARLNKARVNHDRMMKESVAELKANGIDLGEVENYVTRKLDAPDAVKDVLPNPLFGMGGGGGGSKYFAKGRAFETLADAIKAGYPPVSTDLADLDAHRIEAGKRIVLQKQLFDELRKTPSPTDGKPIIGEMEQRKTLSGKTEASIPRGYSVVQAGGQPLVIHNDFAGLFRNLYGSSALRNNAAGRAAIKAAALVKHGTLAVDTFHIGRMLFKMATAGGGGPFTARNGHLAWNIHKGRALLEYNDADIGRAQAMGDITKKEADYARTNRPKIEKLMKFGMNVGKVADNLMEQAKLHLPIVSKLNSWIFGKLSRSAMLQASLVNLERNLKNPNYTEDQAYRQTAKEMNELFGNLQNQGILQNKTLQDLTRLIFLAPNWTESQFRNEARAYAQVGKSAVNAARGKGLRAGNSSRIFAAGLAALLVANQVVNYLTRGKSTFENEEHDHKLDAWIPGGKRGFWFSPLEIAGEYAHAAMKYLAQHENPVDVATHIASNKMSPLARAAKEGLTGRDYAGRHFLSNADRARAAVTDALPVPMFAAGLPFGKGIEKDPRQPLGFRFNRQPAATEKQLLQSVGMKLTSAQSPRSQMFAIAQPFRADRQQNDAAGEYTELRRALDNGDTKSVKSEIQWLYERGKTADAIKRAVGISATGDIKPERFAGNEERETEMLRSLKPEERKIYAAAQADHLNNAVLLQKILPTVQAPRMAPKTTQPKPFAFK